VTVKIVHYSLGNNRWGDTHDTPASEQLIVFKEGTQISTKVSIYKNLHCSCVTSQCSSTWEFLCTR